VREAGERLYDVLVRPFSPFAGAVRALVFVPDVALEDAAFGALWDRRSGRYLVEEYLLGVAPSGRVLVGDPELSTELPPRPRALVVGNPRVDSAFERDLPPLPAAEKEAAEVASLYPASVLLTGRAATRAAFLAALRASDVVHYAGHAATTADDPARSRLFLAPDPASGDSGTLTLRDLPLGTLRARVVVLAACRSAAGASREAGALSLSRSFLAAGAASVVGSLWDLDDEVSRAFFVAFHERLLTEGDATRALRDTQLALLRGSDPILAHPASWSGFVSAGTLHDRR
jgi:CHAT domain-containing protein